MAGSAEGEDTSLAFVDLISCALCGVLLLLFAVLAYRGSDEGTAAAFAILTLDCEYDAPPDPAGVEETLKLNETHLVSLKNGKATPGDLFWDGSPQNKIAPKDFVRDKRSNPVSFETPLNRPVIVSYFQDAVPTGRDPWSRRLMLRFAGRPSSQRLEWRFPAGSPTPKSIKATLTTQDPRRESEPTQPSLLTLSKGQDTVVEVAIRGNQVTVANLGRREKQP